MSRLKTLLAKMDSMDAMDATPYITLIAGENVRHTEEGNTVLDGKSRPSRPTRPQRHFPPLASSDCPDDYARLERKAIQSESSFGESASDDIPGFDDITPITMQKRRAILSRVYGWRYPEEVQS